MDNLVVNDGDIVSPMLVASSEQAGIITVVFANRSDLVQWL
jgi:hypothetical protein